jgi:predicted metalloenzyme YecM
MTYAGKQHKEYRRVKKNTHKNQETINISLTRNFHQDITTRYTENQQKRKTINSVGNSSSYFGTNAIIRAGDPLPPTIFNGIIITIAPLGGRLTICSFRFSTPIIPFPNNKR